MANMAVGGAFYSRRDATRVIYEILCLARRGASKTQLVYGANLNFRLAEGYIEFLRSKRLLFRNMNERQRGVYELTDRGERLLDLLARVEQELFDSLPSPAEESVGVQSRVLRTGL